MDLSTTCSNTRGFSALCLYALQEPAQQKQPSVHLLVQQQRPSPIFQHRAIPPHPIQLVSWPCRIDLPLAQPCPVSLLVLNPHLVGQQLSLSQRQVSKFTAASTSMQFDAPSSRSMSPCHILLISSPPHLSYPSLHLQSTSHALQILTFTRVYLLLQARLHLDPFIGSMSHLRRMQDGTIGQEKILSLIWCSIGRESLRPCSKCQHCEKKCILE